MMCIVGTSLWGLAAGAGTGPLITLHFGSRLPRLRVLDNPNISESLRTHEGEFVLFVKCGWDIEHDGRIIANDGSSNRPQGAMLKALNRLLRRAVKKVAFSSKEVSVEFTGDLVLHLHPKLRHDGLGNYSFSTREQRYVVREDLRVEIKNRRWQKE
jgi:hypothetical protein